MELPRDLGALRFLDLHEAAREGEKAIATLLGLLEEPAPAGLRGFPDHENGRHAIERHGPPDRVDPHDRPRLRLLTPVRGAPRDRVLAQLLPQLPFIFREVDLRVGHGEEFLA